MVLDKLNFVGLLFSKLLCLLRYLKNVINETTPQLWISIISTATVCCCSNKIYSDLKSNKPNSSICDIFFEYPINQRDLKKKHQYFFRREPFSEVELTIKSAILL